jgi:hypothetical protein
MPTQATLRKKLMRKARLPVEDPAILFKVLTKFREAVQEMDKRWPYYQHLWQALDPTMKPKLASALYGLTGSTYDNYCEYLTAFKILRNWPQGFYDFMAGYRQVEYRISGHTIRGKKNLNLGILYQRLLHQKLGRLGYTWLNDGFRQYHYKQKVLAYPPARSYLKQNKPKNKVPYLTIDMAASFLALEYWQVEVLVQAGLLKSQLSSDISARHNGATASYPLLKQVDLEQLKVSGRLDELKHVL